MSFVVSVQIRGCLFILFYSHFLLWTTAYGGRRLSFVAGCLLLMLKVYCRKRRQRPHLQHTHACTHAHALHTPTHTCITYTHTHTHSLTHAHTHAHTHSLTHAHTHAHTHTCACTHTLALALTDAPTHIHTHSLSLSSPFPIKRKQNTKVPKHGWVQWSLEKLFCVQVMVGVGGAGGSSPWIICACIYFVLTDEETEGFWTDTIADRPAATTRSNNVVQHRKGNTYLITIDRPFNEAARMDI